MPSLTIKLEAAGFSGASGQPPNLNIVNTQMQLIYNFCS